MVHHSRPLRSMVLAVLIVLLTTMGAGVASFAASSQKTNAGTIPQGLPTLPVFRFNTPSIGGANNTVPLAQRFSDFANQGSAFEENYLNKPRFTVPNTATTSLITQYGATGGYYAYNVAQIGDQTERGVVDLADARSLACQFLLANNFINTTGQLLRSDIQATQDARTPDTGGCTNTISLSSYSAVLIRSTGIANAPGSQQDPEQILGAVVKVPVGIITNPNFPTFTVPVSGPGGHISLLFRTTNVQDQGPTLDSGTPGLAAVAMPFFDRSFTLVRNVPQVDSSAMRNAVEQNVRATYPTATNVSVITPTLSYWVGDAAEPQTAFEPVLTFSGIQVTVNGETFILKDVVVPAVQSGAGGFGPSVHITSPANGAKYTPGSNVALTGSIADGTAPYTYQWLLDDGTPLSSETALATAGNVSVQTNNLPTLAKNSTVTTVSIILRVTDADGAKRDAVVSLMPSSVPMISLPLISKGGVSALLLKSDPVRSGPVRFAINYNFGIESASDYPPFGTSNPGDLPGVPPDANGLRNGLASYGWGQRFYWSDANVWEKDFRDCSLGGGDCSYGVDRADLVYYSGHSGAGGLSVPNPSKDSGWFAAENARYSTIRWLMLSSCQALRVSFIAAPSEPIRRWFNAFQGASMILGFNSNMADVAFGPRLFDNMRVPTTFFGLIELPWAQLSIRDAWVKTAFDMNAGKPAYLWATSPSYNPADNRLPKGGDGLLPRPLPVNHYYWVWWDCADTDPAGGVCQF